MSKPKRTANHSAWQYVDKREDFQGSSLRGETYERGNAPHITGSWMSDYEEEMYKKVRLAITYVVWSFYTPIAYYIETPDGTGRWYKVGQTFSSYTSRHASGALRNVPGHPVELTGKRGDWTVICDTCCTERHFTEKRAAEAVIHPHR